MSQVLLKAYGVLRLSCELWFQLTTKTHTSPDCEEDEEEFVHSVGHGRQSQHLIQLFVEVLAVTGRY